MFTKLKLATLNWDVLLAIVAEGLDAKDLLNLRLVSVALPQAATLADINTTLMLIGLKKLEWVY
jgi:hypothetical protein